MVGLQEVCLGRFGAKKISTYSYEMLRWRDICVYRRRVAGRRQYAMILEEMS